MLYGKNGRKDDLVVRGARVLDPVEGVDAGLDVRVDKGTIAPLETMSQFQDNLTWTLGDHSVKVGAGLNKIYDKRRSNIFSQYTFPTLAAYLNALNGSNPRGYSNYSEAFGNPELRFRSTFYNLFAQDDWRVTRKLKVNFGLR